MLVVVGRLGVGRPQLPLEGLAEPPANIISNPA